MGDRDSAKHLLAPLNLGDRYQRKARFAPGVLTVFVLLPIAGACGLALTSWLNTLLSGVGLGALLGVAISHLASAAGNRAQIRLWPRWPHDAPTNRWLNPNDDSRSRQQRDNWYSAILRLTALDIRAVVNDGREAELVIEDAVSRLRTMLWKSKHAERLDLHNADYGFARNLLGLMPLWLVGATVSFVPCWILYAFHKAALLWPAIATVVLAYCLVLAWWLPGYVRQKADRYAESFFGAFLDLDRESRTG